MSRSRYASPIKRAEAYERLARALRKVVAFSKDIDEVTSGAMACTQLENAAQWVRSGILQREQLAEQIAREKAAQ